MTTTIFSKTTGQITTKNGTEHPHCVVVTRFASPWRRPLWTTSVVVDGIALRFNNHSTKRAAMAEARSLLPGAQR
jgi:hypothetical protein